MNDHEHEQLRWYESLAAHWKVGVDSFSWHDFLGPRTTFTPAEIRACWALLLADDEHPEARRQVMLYVHVLLCATKCRYCHCSSRAVEGPGEPAALLAALVEEAAAFAELFQGVTMRNVYVGGGTPSLFTDDQFARLMERVIGRFAKVEGGQHSVEFNPASTTPAKLRRARDAGFTRISFGIETLTPGVLARYHRGYQRPETVRAALAGAHQAGFEEIDVDLLVLGGETAATWRDTVTAVLAMEPSTVSLYRFRPLEYFDVSQRAPAVDVGRLAAEQPPLPMAQAYEVFRTECEPRGYVITEDFEPARLSYLVMRGDGRPRWHEVYSEDPEDNASILGLGPYSRSVCRGRARYADQGANLAAGRFAPRYLGSRLTPDADARAYLLHWFSAGRDLSRGKFRAAFGYDPIDRFPAEFRLLAAGGDVDIAGDAVRWRVEDSLRRRVVALVLAGAERAAQVVREGESSAPVIPAREER